MNKYNNFTKELNKQTREVFKHMKSFERLSKEIETFQNQASFNPEARRKLEAIELLESDPVFNSNLHQLKMMVKNIEHELGKLKENGTQGGKEKLTIVSDELRIVKKVKGSELFLNQSK